MYNRSIIVGNLTRNIEVRYTKTGTAISSVGIATNRKFKSQDGEQRNEVMFIDLTFFGRTAEIANQYLKKGSKILVEGRLVFQQWTSQDGTKRSKHSISVDNLQMLGGKPDDSQYQPVDNNYNNSSHKNYNQQQDNRSSHYNNEETVENKPHTGVVNTMDSEEIPF